ncbi:acyl carrier protein [Streptomyces tsukubensis]|uniref:Carrier domain-containing protein n=1 Tax=Streptomyces tsukubensis TaxID=83656 RepID=A0A1V4AEY7_9ACTN|nr:acyl carrier protein [Streptomyces tsukubensis]OON82196.1 hypothetical protein B1H18_03925 [Streptomyces tsukubensis]QFR92684.1 hypothetical protein GBW32_05950 [Streptomyces tsukubensis]
MNSTPADRAAAHIEAFIRREAAVAADDPDFTRQVNLFDTGYLDSLTVVALTVYVEQVLGVQIADTDLFDPAFATIEGMAGLITRHVPDGKEGEGAPGPVERAEGSHRPGEFGD